MHIDTQKIDQIASNIFAPVYILLAQQILDRTGIENGLCLDLGSGGGYLGLALAWNSKLRVCLLDESEDMRRIAEQNIYKRQLETRVTALLGDMRAIPLKDRCANLVVSRDAIYGWDDPAPILREVWRVLAPGGQACIGGGFGSREVRNDVIARMRIQEPRWQPGYQNFSESVFEASLEKAKLKSARVVRDESGTWIRLKKPQTRL